MSWFERRRHRAAVALRGEPAVVLDQPSDGKADQADLRSGSEVDDVIDLAAEPTSSHDAQDPGALPTITGRAGRYVITDGTGAKVGTILGDYVIGFTVQCWGVNRTFSDMESAMSAIAVESQTRAAERLLKAS